MTTNSKNKLVRFGVSLPQPLIEQFDIHIQGKEYSNRSEAIRDLIRQALIEEQVSQDENVLGVLHLLFDHHKRELTERLTATQHDNHQLIISSTHVHLDHTNCLEVILLKGKVGDIKHVSDAMIATKGVKHGQLYLTSTGRDLD